MTPSMYVKHGVCWLQWRDLLVFARTPDEAMQLWERCRGTNE